MDAYVQARGKIARGALGPDFTKHQDRRGKPYLRGRFHVFSVDRFKPRRGDGPDSPPGLSDYKILLRPFYANPQDARPLEEQFETSQIWSRIKPGRQVVFRGRQTDDARVDRRDLERFRKGEIEADQIRSYANLTIWIDRRNDLQFLNEPVPTTVQRILEALAEKGAIDAEKISDYMEHLQEDGSITKPSSQQQEEDPSDEDVPF